MNHLINILCSRFYPIATVQAQTASVALPARSPFDIIQGLLTMILFIAVPLTAAIFAISHIGKLTKADNISVIDAAFHSTKTNLKAILIYTGVFIILNIISAVLFGEVRQSNIFKILLWLNIPGTLLFALVAGSLASGIIYLLSSMLNRKKKIFQLALVNLLVIPSLAIFVWILLCKYIPNLRKYLPAENNETKQDMSKEPAKQ